MKLNNISFRNPFISISLLGMAMASLRGCEKEIEPITQSRDQEWVIASKLAEPDQQWFLEKLEKFDGSLKRESDVKQNIYRGDSDAVIHTDLVVWRLKEIQIWMNTLVGNKVINKDEIEPLKEKLKLRQLSKAPSPGVKAQREGQQITVLWIQYNSACKRLRKLAIDSYDPDKVDGIRDLVRELLTNKIN